MLDRTQERTLGAERVPQPKEAGKTGEVQIKQKPRGSARASEDPKLASKVGASRLALIRAETAAGIRVPSEA